LDNAKDDVRRSTSNWLTAVLALLSLPAVAGAKPAVRVVSLPAETLPDGQSVARWQITNASGAGLTVISLGAVIQKLVVPDREGRLADVVFGYDSASSYLTNPPYFGAVVGRFANRIARGKFTLNGKTYQLAVNNDVNALHGGIQGFDKHVWSGEAIKTKEGAGVRLSRVSMDGEEGYPGTVRISVSYIWTSTNTLIVDYDAKSDAPTPFNISQHSYFNLRGAGSNALATDHYLQLNADHYTPVDSSLIPTGELRSVAGTPFDFRIPKPIGRDIGRADEQLKFGGGYDHNFVLNGEGFRVAAVVDDPVSGRRMTVSTDQPGVQFYSSNFLDGSLNGKSAKHYPYRSGVVLETQHFPDSPNQPDFPSAILTPGQPFHSRTTFTFSTDK